MLLDFLKNKFREIFSPANDEKKWLTQLVESLEKKHLNNENIPFKIIDIKERGFQVKVQGLFAYISFSKMPWKYKNNECWKHIFRYLTNKTFFCKIYSFQKVPLSIIINGKIPQFKELNFEEQEKYEGIIIKKVPYGIFVEFGHHFYWQAGSMIGFIHNSGFDKEEFKTLAEGDLTKSTFCGYDTKERPVFKNNPLNDNFVFIPNELKNRQVEVRVNKIFGENVSYIVLDKYKGTIPVSKSVYPENKKSVKEALKQLNHNDIIHCEVYKIDHRNGLIKLKWNSEYEIKNALTKKDTCYNSLYSISSRIDNETVEKLNIVGDIVRVEIQKEENKFGKVRNYYLVENKYRGLLYITNENYKITNAESQRIEENFQDGEIIKCEVTSITKKLATIKWTISDEEFTRFVTNE